MTYRDILVVGTSAGGVETLSRLVSKLSPDLPAAMFITMHFPAQGISVLPRILSRAGPLSALHPEDEDPIEYGRIYVAPPDRHLLIYREGMRLVRGPTENGNRPAIDPMFRSAAVAFGRQVIGVVLTGNLDDGTAGLLAIKRRNGLAVIQSPEDAMFPSMPASAMQNARADHVVPIDEMAALLERLVREPIPDAVPVRAFARDEDSRENAYSAFDLDMIENPEQHPGEPSTFGCPDCGGTLWRIRDGDLIRYRCRVGHGWTGEALIERQEASLDTALWTALRALEESVTLNNQLAGRFEKRGVAKMASRYRDNARLALERADVIRDVIMSGQSPAPDQPDEEELAKTAQG